MNGEEIENENVVFEATIGSSDPEIRKQARAARIQRRLEQASKEKAIADGTFVEEEQPKPLLDKTIEGCDDQLFQLLLEGKELVSNVQVASEAREVQRRHEQNEARKERMRKLEEEAASALDKFNEITTKWENIVKSNDPLNLDQDMKEQKNRCLDLISQKEALMEDLKLELKESDERFTKDRTKMLDDIAMLARRIDDQVFVMKRAVRTELQMVEGAVDATKTQLLSDNQKSWKALYDEREKQEIINVEKKFELVEECEGEISQIYKDHEEKYRETKIRLETDVQVLEQELEQLKALCLLNSEKLDYNYQVLKKREEENVFIKNHQKKQLNKLQDTVNQLKKQIEERNAAIQRELKKLNEDVKRYHRDVTETEQKSEHFARTNEKQYQEIWDMNTEESTGLLNKILVTDQLIHEQILGLSWESPELILMNKEELPSYRSAMDAVAELLKKEEEEAGSCKDEKESSVEPTQPVEATGGDSVVPAETTAEELDIQAGRRRLLRHILELVADQSGFLIDEKLNEVLEPYSENEKMLVLLDNVFMAIGVSTERDIMIMKDHFLPYARCSLCSRLQQTDMMYGEDYFDDDGAAADKYVDKDEDIMALRSEPSLKSGKSTETKTTPSIQTNQTTATASLKRHDTSLSEGSTLLHQLGVKTDSTESSQEGILKCNESHPLFIEKIYVLKALREFVSEFHKGDLNAPAGMSVRLAKQRSTVSRLITHEDVVEYWNKFHLIFPPSKSKLWDALFSGLGKYHEILQDRHKLNCKVQKLRQQNIEMRRLLQKYMRDRKGIQSLMLPQVEHSSNDKILHADVIQVLKKASF